VTAGHSGGYCRIPGGQGSVDEVWPGQLGGALRARVQSALRQKPAAVASAALPYGMIAVLAVLTIPLQHASHAGLAVDVSLCVLAALWLLVLNTLWPRRPGTAGATMFVTGLFVITAALVVRDSWFGFFVAVGFGYTRTLLRWPWQQAGAAAVAVIGAMSQTAGIDAPLPLHVTIFAFVFLLDLALMTSLMWLLWARDEQIARHQQALTELRAANQRLEATIAENEGLHQQLLVQAREAGVLDERQRMAREIHDTLAQGLTGIVTQLQAAEQAAGRSTAGPAEPAGWRRHVGAATRLARESLSEARRSVEALRPEPLEGSRLSEALAGVAERWSVLHGVPVQITTTGTVRPVQPEAEFALLRAAQEALANVARHAHATRVGLTVSYMENEVAVDVRDDGVGFDAAGNGHGFGLVAMRQRIAALSGTLQVESEPGGGTAISACVPTVAALASQ
jgi:signal transduction histidine kinase